MSDPTMKLFYNPRSPYSRKVLVALYEKGIEVERELVELFDWVAMSRYRQDINPLGKLPYLMTGEGGLPESSAIIEHLDVLGGGARLIPEDPAAALRARLGERTADLYVIEPAVTLWLQGMKPAERQNPELIDRARMTLNRSLPLLDSQLDGVDYLVGDALSIADISACSGVRLLGEVGVSLADYSNITPWLDRNLARNSWKLTLEESERCAATMKEL